MKFTVLWIDEAQAELANAWLDARDRSAVTAAANSIDRELADDPISKGESRDGSLRIIFARPLGVEDEVVEDDRTVFILSVWHIEKDTPTA